MGVISDQMRGTGAAPAPITAARSIAVTAVIEADPIVGTVTAGMRTARMGMRIAHMDRTGAAERALTDARTVTDAKTMTDDRTMTDARTTTDVTVMVGGTTVGAVPTTPESASPITQGAESTVGNAATAGTASFVGTGLALGEMRGIFGVTAASDRVSAKRSVVTRAREAILEPPTWRTNLHGSAPQPQKRRVGIQKTECRLSRRAGESRANRESP